MGSEDEFENRIDRIVGEYEAARLTRRMAQETEEDARQAFLSAFRLARDRVVVPTLERVARHPALKRPHPPKVVSNDEAVYISIFQPSVSPAELNIHGRPRMTISADFVRKQAACVALINNEEAELAVWLAEEITEAAVQEAAELFLRKALSV